MAGTDGMTDREKDYKEFYDMCWASFGTWQGIVHNDLQVYLGDSWSAIDKMKCRARNLTPMNFPKLRQNVKWISGYQRDHRLGLSYDPTEGADESTANQFTKMSMYTMAHNKGHYRVSSAFEGALKTGINLVNLFNDRNFDTKFETFNYNQFLLDPNFSEIDLSDCYGGILRKFITQEAAKMILPGKEREIDGLISKGVDNKFNLYTKPSLYGQKLLAYDEFQRRVTKQSRVIIIRETGEEIPFDGNDSQLVDFLAMNEINPELIKVEKRWTPTVEVLSYLEGREMEHEINLFGIDDFSFTPIIAYFDPEYDLMEDKLQSVIHGLIDSQRADDKRMTSMTALFDMQIGAGVDYEDGTFVDEDDAFKTGSGSPRKLTEGALSNPAGPKFKDRAIPDIPQGMFALHDIFERGIPKMAGINEEMAGQVSNNKLQMAGVLAKMRAGAGLVGLRGLFDNLEQSVACIGTKMLKLLQQYPSEKVKRILNEEPTPNFYTKDFGKYDCVASEGVLTDTQMNESYMELLNLKELGGKLGDPAPITWKMLLSRIKMVDKSMVVQEIDSMEKQKAKRDQMMQKIQMQLQQLAVQKEQGEIASDRGMAEERRTQATENSTGAALDRVKTMQQIQDLKNAPILELAKMAVELEKITQQNKTAEAKS